MPIVWCFLFILKPMEKALLMYSKVSPNLWYPLYCQLQFVRFLARYHNTNLPSLAVSTQISQSHGIAQNPL